MFEPGQRAGRFAFHKTLPMAHTQYAGLIWDETERIIRACFCRDGRRHEAEMLIVTFPQQPKTSHSSLLNGFYAMLSHGKTTANTSHQPTDLVCPKCIQVINRTRPCTMLRGKGLSLRHVERSGPQYRTMWLQRRL